MVETIDTKEAFGRLVEQYQSPLRRYLFHLTHGNGALADDLAQDTFIKAYTHWDDFRGNGFKTWLFKIAYRTFIDNFRSVKISVDLDYAKGAYSAASHMEVLNETLACLDHVERNLVILSYVEQLSHSEIEKVTGMRLGSIKTTIRRAKEKLNKFLSDEKE